MLKKDKNKVNKNNDNDHIEKMKAFIKSKKEENKALKKIIDKLNIENNFKDKH